MSKKNTETSVAEEQVKERQRKEYATKGTRSQKTLTFRCDNDNLEWLESQPNKGRAINKAIAQARLKEK